MPVLVWETVYEVLYREEEEHRYRHELAYDTRLDSKTVYLDEEETRFTNEYEVIFRTEEEIRYYTEF